MSPAPFVLASGSPRRKRILETLGFAFDVRPCEMMEERLRDSEATVSPKSLALAKARRVARTYPDTLVVGADTLVVVGGEVLGKPDNRDDARRMLELLSGRTHAVVSGVALVHRNRASAAEALTHVQFRTLASSEIEWYLSTDEPWDKAGAYAIQGSGGALVERIDGSFLNVVGFPVGLFIRMLQDFTGRSWLHFLKPLRQTAVSNAG